MVLNKVVILVVIFLEDSPIPPVLETLPDCQYQTYTLSV